jgi:hypothetical protein
MPGSPSNSRLGRIVGLAFAAVAIVLVAVDNLTDVDVGASFSDPSPLTFGLGVLAVVAVVVLYVLGDSAFD